VTVSRSSQTSDRRGRCFGRLRPKTVPRPRVSRPPTSRISMLCRASGRRRDMVVAGRDAKSEAIRQLVPGPDE
jgi:hypothetical protein